MLDSPTSGRSNLYDGGDDVIRAEVFSIEQQEQHAESVARAHRVAKTSGLGRSSRLLQRRLRDNDAALRRTYQVIAQSIRDNRTITPAAEWLIDNSHVVEKQIRDIRINLPPGFYRQLPKLAQGPQKNLPRIFGLAWALVAHTDSRFDPQALIRFVAAYQRVQPLTIGELWALAITLRIVLVENLRRLADGIALRSNARREADALADRVLGLSSGELSAETVALWQSAKSPMSVPFAAQLVQRLRDQDPAVTPAVLQLEDRLRAFGTTADDVVRDELQRQGTTNITVRNVITSMRRISEIDWAEMFEAMSLVDATLRAGSNFAAMDFATRNRYRGAIETLARRSRYSEPQIAQLAVERAERAASAAPPEGGVDPREADPGYYLISAGRRRFEEELGYRVSMRDRQTRLGLKGRIAGYLGSIAVLSLLILAVVIVLSAQFPIGAGALVIAGLLGLFPASDVALALVNRIVASLYVPHILPALDLRDGVPAELRTLVAVPTLLTSETSIREQIERLEVHHLASPEGDLYFALLSDWTDAVAEAAPGDDELLAFAAAGIKALNDRYGPGPVGPRFRLLHRRRVWNEGEGTWIGWERKRGKLLELNRLLRGAEDTTFLADARSVPPGVRYVITLDADTRLPRAAARRLIGKMAHPLNHPRLDPQCCRVVEGYAILQPRVTPSLPTGREGSLFQRTFSSPSGLDPYAFAISDVYQDLFGEGSYCGKGIYDVTAFEAALDRRIPENIVLSHDLLEGIFARAGFASDIEVVEEFPTRYEVAAARQHRWVRGDWQLLPWIFGRGRDAIGGRERTAIPVVGRWKMLDNLRRSLSAPASLLLLILAWSLAWEQALLWTGLALAAVVLPALLPLLASLLPHHRGISLRRHFHALGRDALLQLIQIGFLTTFLAHQAWVMADAVIRTLARVFIRRRGLLEWVTAAQAKATLAHDPRRIWHQAAGSIGFAICVAALIAVAAPWSLLVAAPFLLLWAVSPFAAWWASRPPAAAGHLAISETDEQALRLIARRTWRFFEVFITSKDCMLPPDNVQEDPAPVVAHRSSPTNIGLYLLSVVAARDFGWIGLLETVERLEATMDSMRGLERYRGHFYNWYDTQDRRALTPKYVSSVDSGNLAGHLLTIANTCRELIGRPVLSNRASDGIGDALRLTRDCLAVLGEWRSRAVTRRQLEAELDAIDALLSTAATTPSHVSHRLAELQHRGSTLDDMARTLNDEGGDAATAEMAAWAQAVAASIRGHHRVIERLLPWAGASLDSFLSGQRDESFRSELEALFPILPSLGELPELCETAIGILIAGPREKTETEGVKQHTAASVAGLIDALERSAGAARSVERRLVALSRAAREMFEAMEFGFLFDTDRQLLSIGCRLPEGTLDPNCYDLLASEARLASFVAIAKGDIPARHWFRLGRSLTTAENGAALISWSGSMFEYLMPSLVMRAPRGSLLEQTNRLVVHRQISYGAERGVPWGISESLYNARDVDFTYQYSTFGIPDLAYKRGLGEDTVIAPYATGLGAMVAPAAAVANFEALAALGGRGRYGWYEALDFTPARLPKDEKTAVVRAYMAHHQAMLLVAVADALHDGAMRSRFHADPIIQATELLLQERMPRDVALVRPTAVDSAPARVGTIVPPAQRRYASPHYRIPQTHLLSNGRYAVMLTSAGSGYSHWRGIAVTRWREDVTCDPWGAYVFLRDVETGSVWSAGYQPSGVEPDSYHVAFSEDRAEFVRRDGRITTTLEIAVSPQDDGEVRRVTIANLGNRAREIELTSYAELVLAPQTGDTAHPAYSKMFVQTEFVASAGTLLATRRRQSPGEEEVWAAHFAVVEGEAVGDRQFETDRARFLGRGQGVRKAVSVIDGWPLSNTVGTVLDPIFSLRTRVKLAPGASARIALWTFVARSREEILRIVEKHTHPAAYERVATLAWTQAQVQLHHLGISPDEAHIFQRLANAVLYSDATLRPSSRALLRGGRNRKELWALGVSGDLPIILLRFEENEDLDIVRELLRAKEYWSTKLLAVDLVLLNERTSSYVQDLQSAVEAMVRTSHPAPRDGVAAGGVFTLRADHMPIEARELLQTAARVVLLGRRGSLAEQLLRPEKPLPAPAAPAQPSLPTEDGGAPQPRPELRFFNGLGGFSPDGRDYVTVIDDGQWTPAPWVNVIANPAFGFQVSTDGAGYSWWGNSRENQITPWSNDPVSDMPGEVYYVSDEESGVLWSPTALPIREDGTTYIARHGQGYSRFEHRSQGIALELLQYVAPDDPIKISRLKLRNLSGRARRLRVSVYAEWSLGPSRNMAAPYITTESDQGTKALLARNPWNLELSERVAFLDLGGRQETWTGDRTEFLGRDGALDQPAALLDAKGLSNRVGAGLDPCGVLQAMVELKPDETREIVAFLGQGADRAEALTLVGKYRSADLDGVLAAVTQLWDEILGAVQVKTPDPALDLMLNRWLVYQALSGRIWARAGFYQASGAYGFRDQLQDVLALTATRPDLTRAHILRAAARQFPEGDVQHWWLPLSGQGVRTRFSDDRVWLPYAVAHYIDATGDSGILDEPVPFLEGPVLKPEETEAFFLPTVSESTASLFEHCALALDTALATGTHGLPLMGTGDWNDGMNRVGADGKGESVWLGWFLHLTLSAFSAVAERLGRKDRCATWRQHAEALREALEREAWDGDWYRRAFFDDGAPLGSVTNSECRIDSIAQSWAVISEAGDRQRGARAMAAVDKYLIRRDDGIALLFTPPFDRGATDPGRIKGYPPGLRENGGQYTHAAIWSVVAFAMLGEGDKAAELFSLLNPINHGNSRAAIHRYKLEPYVIAADVYSIHPHVGRGGWTWYTGSAGWMYRSGLESILGFHLRGTSLLLRPSVPRSWTAFEIVFRYRTARYEIAFENPEGVSVGIASLELDGTVHEGDELERIELSDDGRTHKVRVTLGSPQTQSGRASHRQ